MDAIVEDAAEVKRQVAVQLRQERIAQQVEAQLRLQRGKKGQ